MPDDLGSAIQNGFENIKDESGKELNTILKQATSQIIPAAAQSQYSSNQNQNPQNTQELQVKDYRLKQTEIPAIKNELDEMKQKERREQFEAAQKLGTARSVPQQELQGPEIPESREISPLPEINKTKSLANSLALQNVKQGTAEISKRTSG